MLDEYWQNYKSGIIEGINLISSKDINKLSNLFESKFNNNSEIHIIGNGGSAANASHINGDFTKTFSLYGKSIKIRTHADNISYLTAVSNDKDYSEVFTLLIPGIIKKDDLIIFLSGSGNSINLVNCANKAKDYFINTFCITGYNGGQLKKICNDHIYIPIKDMEVLEDLQLIIFHSIKQKLCRKIERDGLINEKSPKYEKRISDNEIA